MIVRSSRCAVGLAVIGVATIAAGESPGAVTRATVSIVPQVARLDQAVAIDARGFRPRSSVVLTAVTRDFYGKVWTSHARFRADASGRVDPARSPALAGTYVGTEPMGLLTSMQPEDSTDPVDWDTLYPLDGAKVTVSATVEGRVVARASFERRTTAPGVTERTTTRVGEGFVGRFCRPPRSSRAMPAILLVGGSGGGFANPYAASLFASHGYPTLDLAYFGRPGLPHELKEIPLEYFVHALRWLAKQPGVESGSVGIFGVSRGAEAALLLGSLYPDLVDDVIAYAGSSVVLPAVGRSEVPAWTVRGKAVPYSSRNLGKPSPSSRAAIEVEKIRGPVFLVCGGSDNLSYGCRHQRAIVARLRRHGRRSFTSLEYPAAGHGVGFAVPYTPIATVVDTRYGVLFLGGTVATDAAARADSWPRLLAFLARQRTNRSGAS